MTVPPSSVGQGAKAWPLSTAAYHALGDMGLIPECWLVLGPEERIEAHRSPVGTSYTEMKVLQSSDVLESSAVPSLAVPLEAVFRS